MASQNISSIALPQPLKNHLVTWLQRQTAGWLVKLCPEVVAYFLKKPWISSGQIRLLMTGFFM